MSTRRSRTARRLPEAPHTAAIGQWGMWLLVVALGTALSGFAAAALYLHTGQPAWPPDGIDRPAPVWALAGLAANVVSWGLAGFARHSLRKGLGDPVAPSLTLATAAAAAAVWLLSQDLGHAGFRWDAHAYTSVYWVLTATAAVLIGIGMLLLAATVLQRLTGVLDDQRMLELELTHLYLSFTVLATIVCLALVHLLPDPSAAT